MTRRPARDKIRLRSFLRPFRFLRFEGGGVDYRLGSGDTGQKYLKVKILDLACPTSRSVQVGSTRTRGG